MIIVELIARFLFYDISHAAIAGTDEDHRVVVLDEELMRLSLRHFLDNLGRQGLQFDVLRHDVADSVGRRALPRQILILQKILPDDIFILGRQCQSRQWWKRRRCRRCLGDHG